MSKATKIACRHAHSKRQIQVESYQNGKWGGKKHFKTILMEKTGEKILFFGRSNWREKKGNLGHVVQIHVCRQVSLMTSLRTQTAYFRKIRLRSQANINQHYAKKCLYIKACVLNKAQLCASSACISGHVLSDKEQN